MTREAIKEAAEAAFKQPKPALPEYERQARVLRERTARLRALRLARTL